MTLPAEILAKEDVRNGHIDRTLSFPLEDLDVDGQPGGQVGQEIYGAGAAFVFATRSFHEVSRPFGCNIGSGIHSRPKQRSEEHTSELQSLMRISYAVFCLKKKNNNYKRTS